MFLSRRLVCPTLDHLKLERIQSSKTLEWLEQQKQKFQFQGIVDQQKLYEEIKNKNIIIGGNADRKEQLINLLKLYDKIIFIKGEENDGKAMEMAHVSIGPHESRSCIKLFNHLEQSDHSYISSMYECISQGRAVYFYILSYSYALACTSQTIMIFAISSAILSDDIFIMPIPTFIIFYLTLNHFSHQIQKQCNQDVQTYVMHRSPYTKQGRIIDRHTMRKLYKLHSILIVELLIASYYGFFNLFRISTLDYYLANMSLLWLDLLNKCYNKLKALYMDYQSIQSINSQLIQIKIIKASQYSQETIQLVQLLQHLIYLLVIDDRNISFQQQLINLISVQ